MCACVAVFKNIRQSAASAVPPPSKTADQRSAHSALKARPERVSIVRVQQTERCASAAKHQHAPQAVFFQREPHKGDHARQQRGKVPTSADAFAQPCAAISRSATMDRSRAPKRLMPPTRFTKLVKPSSCSIKMASRLRMPLLHCTTTSTSRGISAARAHHLTFRNAQRALYGADFPLMRLAHV
jgi:hypothetical protein